MVCFAVWSPSVWEAEVTAFSRQLSQFVWVDTFFVEPAECASEETGNRGWG